jgi:poly(ADP-ribose) glycohydrolase ARH3
MTTRERFQGCLLGLALGDALGAPYEGGPLERGLWRLLGTTGEGKMRWTDDTQMSLDVADSLIANGQISLDDMARRFAASYRWSRGYGPGAAKVLKRIRGGQDWRQASTAIYPEGSYGNGGAMRAPVLGLLYHREPGQLATAVESVCRITHAHRLAIDGARLVAMATALSLHDVSTPDILASLHGSAPAPAYGRKLQVAAGWLAQDQQVSVRQLATGLGRGIAAIDSCVTAIYLGLRFRAREFAEMQSFIAQGGGDADTIGAMAGAIWGAGNGWQQLPQAPLARLEQQDRLLATATALHAQAGNA